MKHQNQKHLGTHVLRGILLKEPQGMVHFRVIPSFPTENHEERKRSESIQIQKRLIGLIPFFKEHSSHSLKSVN